MSKTVELSDDLYEKLERLAKAQDMTIEALIEKMTQEVAASRLSAAIEQMRAKGIIAEQRKPVEPITVGFKRIKVSGKPVSETIIEERR